MFLGVLWRRLKTNGVKIECLLALLKLLFSFSFFVFTECRPLRCCLALLYHQIARHQFRRVSLGR